MKPNLAIQRGSWVKKIENTSLQQVLYYTSLPYFSRAADQGLKCQGCFSIWVYLWWLTLHTSPTISSFSWAITDHHHLWTLAFCSLISTFLYPPILIYEHTSPPSRSLPAWTLWQCCISPHMHAQPVNQSGSVPR